MLQTQFIKLSNFFSVSYSYCLLFFNNFLDDKFFYHLYCVYYIFIITATVKLPAEKFLNSDESPTVMSLEKKTQQIILNSGEELFAEIRYFKVSSL